MAATLIAREVLLLLLINGARIAAAVSSCSTKSGAQLCCPVGMRTYGDGSACKAIGKPSCALWGNAGLDICPTSPNSLQCEPGSSANPSGWTHCANEYGTCVCDGMVRFGDVASDKWSATQASSGSISCGVSVFGDPKYGVVKSCQCSIDFGSKVTPAVKNGDFELDPTSRFVYRVPQRWTGKNRVVIIYRGRGWGNLRSGAGDHYVGLQAVQIGSDVKLSQTVSCLTPGVWYRLSVKAACRPSYGDKYEFGVEISGQSRRIFSQANGDFSCSGFRQLDIDFDATYSNTTVSFLHIATGSDRTVFLDDVRIQPVSQTSLQEPSTENFVFKFSATQTWREARQSCQKVCTACDLAEISSSDENEQVAQAVRDKCMPCNQFPRDPNECSWSGVAWIGLHDSVKEGTFVWSQSQSKYLDGWTNPTFKPDNGWSGGEDFVALGSEGTWNDLNQAWKLACAVCQRPVSTCKAGQRFDMEPRPQCIDCPAGTHMSNRTANTCLWCEAGKFSASGQSTCKMCPAGKYSTLQGTSADDAEIEVGSRVIIVLEEAKPSKDVADASRGFLEPGDVGTVIEIRDTSLESSQGRLLASSFLILSVSASSGFCQISDLDGGSGCLTHPLVSLLLLASFPTGLCFPSKKRYRVAASDGTRGWFDEGSITLIVCTPCPEGTKSAKGASKCTSSPSPTPASGSTASTAASACQQPSESISQVGLRVIFQVLLNYNLDDFDHLRQRKFTQAIAAAASGESTCAIAEKDVNITRIAEDGADFRNGRHLLADGIAVDVSIAMISEDAGNELVQRGSLTKESINRELTKYELAPITEISSSPVLQKREQDRSRETTSDNNSLNVGGLIAFSVIFFVAVAAVGLFSWTRRRRLVHANGANDAPPTVHVTTGGGSNGSGGGGGGGGGGNDQFRPPPLCRSRSVKSVEDFVRARTEKARAMAMDGAPDCRSQIGSCLICAGEGVSVIVQEGCNHPSESMCKSCLASYIRERLEDIEHFPVKCAMHSNGCPKTISFRTAAIALEDRSEFEGESSGHRSAAIARDKNKFLQFHLTKAVGYIVSCPCCHAIVISQHEVSLHGQPVRCNNLAECGKRFCVDCEVEWHQGLTCAQYKGEEVDDATQRLLDQGKKCPGCGTGIIHYYNHECHHIKPDGGCPTCHHHFCYVCLGSYHDAGTCQAKGCTSGRCRSQSLPRCTSQSCPFSGSSFCRNGCGCPPCPDCKPSRPCRHCSSGCPVCQPDRTFL